MSKRALYFGESYILFPSPSPTVPVYFNYSQHHRFRIAKCLRHAVHSQNNSIYELPSPKYLILGSKGAPNHTSSTSELHEHITLLSTESLLKSLVHLFNRDYFVSFARVVSCTSFFIAKEAYVISSLCIILIEANGKKTFQHHKPKKKIKEITECLRNTMFRPQTWA